MPTSIDYALNQPATARDLVRFHIRHKLLLMAHAPSAVGVLGRLVARAKRGDLDGAWAAYQERFRAALSTPTSRAGHAYALLHAVGYFRGLCDDTTRRALLRAIEAYAAGASSLAAPIRLIRARAIEHKIDYLIDQVYLQPPNPAHDC